MTTAGKFGIGATSSGRAILQPKLKYRYRVKFNMGGTEEGEFSRNVVTCDRPKLSHTEIPIHSYNSIAYISGKHEWATISCTFRDDIKNSIVKLVGTQLQRQIDHHEQASAKSAQDFKFGMTIDFLTGTHGDDGKLDQWGIEGCWIQNADYDQGDYAGSDPLQVTLTIRFDNALHSGIGGVDLMPTDGLQVLTGENATGKVDPVASAVAAASPNPGNPHI